MKGYNQRKIWSWDNLQTPKDDTFLKAHYRQMFLKCLYSEADYRQQPF